MMWRNVVELHQMFSQFLSPWMGMDQDRKGLCCVGGILVMVVWGILDPWDAHVGLRFPNQWTLTQALVDANPWLPEQKAWEYAEQIIALNDDGRFSAAFDVLEHALGYSEDPSVLVGDDLVTRQLNQILEEAGERPIVPA